MATITDAAVREMYRQMYRKGEGKEEIKADGLMDPDTIKAVFQAIEDRWESGRTVLKADVDAAAGRTVTAAVAKKFGRTWMRRKWGLE